MAWDSQAGSPAGTSSGVHCSPSESPAGNPAAARNGAVARTNSGCSAGGDGGSNAEEEVDETNPLDQVYEAVADLDQSVGWVDVELVIIAVQEQFENDNVLRSIESWVALGVFVVRRHVSKWQVRFAVTPIRESSDGILQEVIP